MPAVLLSLAIALLATACDRGPGAKGGGVASIKVVIADYSKDNTGPFWRSLSEAYTKQTGVKVDLQVIDWNSIDQQVTTMIQNNQPPDVLNLNSFSSYAKDGLLNSSEDVLSAKTRDDFLAAFARGGEYQGKLYGFPILSSARAFFYNKSLFAKAKIAAPPKTWDEFVKTAQKITALGKGTIGYALPLGPEEAQAEWSIWMWNNGGDWKSGDQWAINSDKNLQTLKFLAVRTVGLSRVDLGHLVPVGEIGEKLQRLEVLVAVDRPLIAGLPVTAVVPHPDGPLGLGLLGTQRKGVADGVRAERPDSPGRRDELVPRPGWRGDPGAREEIPVVEEGACAREDREPVELALVLTAPDERGQEVFTRPGREDLVRRVEQSVLRVAGEGVQVQHVGRLVVLDHRGDLLVDRVPVDDLQVHLDAGLLRVRLGEGLPEGTRVVLAVVGDDDLDRREGAALGAASLVAGGREERRDRADPPEESGTSSHQIRDDAVLSPGRALCLVAPEHLAHRPSLVGDRVPYDAVRLASLVVLGQVLGDGDTFGRHEQEAMAVLVLLHLVAGADPAPLLRLRGRIRIEIAGTERLAHLLDVAREPCHDRLGDGAVGVERSAGLLRVLPGVRPHLVDVRCRGLVHETSDSTRRSAPRRWRPD